VNLSRPLTSLIPSLEGDVLTVLAGAKTSFTGLQVQKIIGKRSVTGVSKTLQKLCALGIVYSRSAGKANLYELNREHVLAKYIIEITKVREEFFRSLSLEVGSWQLLPECAAVFGSAARSDMTSESDIDVFVARPPEVKFGEPIWRQQLTDFSLKVQRWTGNSVQIFELGDDEIKRELGSKGGAIYSIIDDGVVIYGSSDYLRKLRNRVGAK